jgi:phosphoribosylamine--glycine ligase
MAAADYPDAPKTGSLITGVSEAEQTGATVFHAGTRRDDCGLAVNGGRVLGVTAAGDTLPAAIHAAYRGVEKIHFDGMQYRRDIGEKGLRRW